MSDETPDKLPLTGNEQPASSENGSGRTFAEIEAWLVARVAEAVAVEPSEIDPRDSFASYGLSSREAVTLSGELGDWLGRELSPTLAWEYPSTEALARYLAQTPKRPEPVHGQSPHSQAETEPIAIVGIGCRFPGADGPDDFWRLLSGGIDAISEIPADRPWLAAAYDEDATRPGAMNTRWGGFLKRIDQFAPGFFGISPREAARMDPQQRLLLEVAWEALEDAGLVPERLAGTPTGVFIGISTNDYGRFQFADPSQIDPYTGTGNALSIAANRISYLFDFAGPSLAIDTACSSSLVAVHLACESLLRGESGLALAGGVNLILEPGITINFTKAGVMAPDGRCKTFDARADGYVRGEGAGIVVLKRLSQAVADGDPIYAVILGSAVNQDGRTNGLMAPNPQRQEEVLRAAYARAGVSPGAVQYVEAHGTGTLLGDPIEASALGNVLRLDRPAGSVCAIGSVKTNIGHLEAAAGVAGLIKVALALKHRALPPSLHFAEPNPHIPFDELPLRVQTRLAPWPASDCPLLAGISAFGFGGTNAHAVLTQAPEFDDGRSTRPPDDRPHLLPLSARSPEELRALANAYREFLTPDAPGANTPLDDITANASLRRSHHDERLAIVARTHAELSEQLTTYLAGEPRREIATGRAISAHRHKLAFVFPGQGSQWVGMGRRLLASEPEFHQAIKECDQALRRHIDWSLLDELAADEPNARLDRIEVVQPAIFAIQVALAALWRSWGIEPDAVVGHSMGEVAAAYVAGALSLDDAARVISQRSRLMQRASGLGRTALVELSPDDLQPWLAGFEDRISIAAHNSPTSTVIAGETDAVERIVTDVERAEVFARLVKTDVAAHSPQMDPVCEELRAALAGLRARLPSVPIYSSVTGLPSQGRQFDADYWVRNLRQPVLFMEAVDQLLDRGFDIFLELSPHPILLNALQQCLDERRYLGQVLPSMRRGDEELTTLGSLGALYTLGVPVDWSRLFPVRIRPVRLPTYRWQRERCWFQPEASAESGGRVLAAIHGAATGGHPLLARRLATAQPIWETTLDPRRLGWLSAARLDGKSVLPAAGLIEMALASVERQGPVALAGIEFKAPLTLPEGGSRTVQLIQTPSADGPARFQIFSRDETSATATSEWTLHAAGCLEPSGEPPRPGAVDLAAIQSRCDRDLSIESFYERLAGGGLTYDAGFRTLEEIRQGDGEAFGRLRLDQDHLHSSYRLAPELIELALQLLIAAAPGSLPSLHLSGIDRMQVWETVPETVVAHARLSSSTGDPPVGVTGDLDLFDQDGRPIAELRGLRLTRQLTGQPGELSRAVVLAAAPDQRQPLLESLFRVELARVLGIAAARIDLDQPLDLMGLDSLMALQLENQIERALEVRLSPADLLLGPSLRELAEIVLERLQADEDARARARQRRERSDASALSPGGTTDLDSNDGLTLEHQLARLGQLSDEEMDSLLAELLADEKESR